MRNLLLALVVLLAILAAYLIGRVTGRSVTPQVSTIQDTPLELELQFVNHLQAGMTEQDAYIEKESGSAEIYRVTADDREAFLEAPLYATVEANEHNPFDASTDGPYPRGEELGITLGEWLAGEGTGSYRCEGSQGTLSASFKNLVPNGLYSMWYFFLPSPPTDPFHGTFDLPLGARDGSENSFRSDDNGNASYQATFEPCLRLSGDHLDSGLAIAWHRDDNTYASSPGPFGSATYVQLFLLLPDETTTLAEN